MAKTVASPAALRLSVVQHNAGPQWAETKGERVMARKAARIAVGFAVGSAATLVAAMAAGQAPAPSAAPNAFAARCTAQAIAPRLAGIGIRVTVSEVPNGPRLPGGTRYVAAAGRLPGYCQVTGSYVTNPATGKTANFIATLPDNWNGKYLQLGCSGSCGVLIMNNPVMPVITITAQGYPGQLLEKGYATFGNDLGHTAPMGSPAISSDWLIGPDGKLAREALEDYLYRADLVMADMGKAFARAFYAPASGPQPPIARSYYMGCSQGGRGAMVAAARFPAKFDGIIAGSPAIDLPGLLFQPAGRALQAQQAGFTPIAPAALRAFQQRVMAQCDARDGVSDGLIQNPAACAIRAERDAPLCPPGESGPSCVTPQQAEFLSTFLTAATDQRGRIVYPGYAVSEVNLDFRGAANKGEAPDRGIRLYAPEAFAPGRQLVSLGRGGAGRIDAFRVIADAAAYDTIRAVVRKGTVEARDLMPLARGRTKLLWYHNLSDEALTPYMSFDRYKALAGMTGGYARLQRNVRLFPLPGTGHCGMSGVGPTNFDAIGALEAWVEQGKAPDSIYARQLDPKHENLMAGRIDWSKPPLRSMPLCPFPRMARYKGTGDVKEAANWECPRDDARMLEIGESGRLAGLR
jgi:feruloyl esterase